MSTSGGVWTALQRGRSINCEAVQIFVKNNMQWAGKPFLAHIFDRVKKPERLGICLDTAHLFAAGYDIRNPAGWDRALDELDSLVGLDQVVAFHLNDSKTDLGSRVDRHEHIGKGKIGLDAFRHIVNDDRFSDHPACLETPRSDDLHEDIENLRVLNSLVAEKASGRRRARPKR